MALSSVINSGATLALGKSFSASKFWDEVIASEATAFVYIGEICRYLLNQPPKPTDRAHKVRVIAGNGLRPEIWDEFTKRFGIARVCEFYASSEGNTAFINIFNVPRTTGIFPMPVAYVEYDPDTGAAAARRQRAGAPGARGPARSAAQPGQPAAAVRRLHRQGVERKEVGAQRFS